MDMFNPETRESTESFWEKREFNEAMEEKIIEGLRNNKEKFPDPVACPNPTCKNPIEPRVEDETVLIHCKACGFKRVITKPKD